EDRVSAARSQCSTLAAEDRPVCETELDSLLVAAQEAYHLGRGECSALTSAQARAMCTPNAAARPGVTPTAAPPSPSPLATPRPSSASVLIEPLAVCPLPSRHNLQAS